MTMDIVYPVRDGDHNEELRYSLRSLKHILHGQVFLAGYAPSWTQNIIHLSRPQLGTTKYKNSTQNILLACNDPRVSDDFILMNDDFFIMKPLKEIPARHRGPVQDVIDDYKARNYDGQYVGGMEATRDLLYSLGSQEPFSYELHIPMVINKKNFIQMYETGKHLPVLHKRTLYGNMFQIGGEKMDDVKETFKRRDANAKEFFSTDEKSFLMLGQHKRLMRLFKNKSRYEK